MTTHTPGLMQVDGSTIYIVTSDPRPQNRITASVQRGFAADGGRTLVAETEQTARRLAAAWNACDGIDTALLEGMSGFNRARDRYFVEHEAADRLRQASLKLLNALGGEPLVELRAEASALQAAISASAEAAEGRAAVPLSMTKELSVLVTAGLDAAMTAFDRLGQGETFNAVCEDTGCTERVREALASVRDAQLRDSSTQPDAAMAMATRAMTNQTPRHLFEILASDADGSYTYFVSAQCDSDAQAREIAIRAVLAHADADLDPPEIGEAFRLGLVSEDIFTKVGPY